MTNLFELAAVIKTTLAEEDYHRYVLELKDGYSLSCLTGSHFNSAELQTVEVALMHNDTFAFGDDDSDFSIIHYMSWALFLDFIGDMNSVKEGKARKSIKTIFAEYKDWAYEM